MSGGAILHRFWAFRVVDGQIVHLSRNEVAATRVEAAENYAQDLGDVTGCMADGETIMVGVILATSDVALRDVYRWARFFRVADYGSWIKASALTVHQAPTLADVEVAA